MSNAYQPEVDFLHSWAVLLPKFSGQCNGQDCCTWRYFLSGGAARRSKSEAARENPPATSPLSPNQEERFNTKLTKKLKT